MLPALPCDLDERYTLTAELGRGSHAIVYRALDRHLDREVAVKVLREELLGSDVSERFQREIRLTSKLEHPNIAHVYGTGEFLGKPYFVIALARGATLGERLKHEHQLPVPEALSIAKQVASALQHAHSAGIIHRDVKPENILLTPDGALLSDFGVARALEMAPGTLATSTGTAVGTLLYMSPEQLCAEKEIDGRSDQYALALVLYEMLAGVSAHTAANAEGLRGLRIVGQHAPVRAHRPTVPDHVEAALQQALMPAPADRFSSMNAFMAALDGEQVSASYRVSATNPAVKPVAVHSGFRRLALGAAAVAGVTAMGVLGKTYLDPPAATAAAPVTGIATQYTISAEGDASVSTALATELSLWSPDVRAVVGDAARDGVSLQTRATPVTDGLRVSVQLRRGVSEGTRVVLVTVPATGAERADSLRVLAARVLVASQVHPDSMDALDAVVERPFPALRQYADGWAALLTGDLVQAEQRFADAARTGMLPQATLWQATVATWRQPVAPGTWRDAAMAARSIAGVLPERDSLLAEAITDRATGRMSQACDAYRRATTIGGGSFGAWYGLAECLHWDSLAVSDPVSPTGLRFRTSRWAALEAYRQAIQRLPSAGLVTMFDRLPRVALAGNSTRRGGVLVDGTPVQGLPEVRGDSVVVFPMTMTRMNAAGARDVPSSYQAAVRTARSRLLDLTTQLAERAPNSFGALLLHARALEYAGVLDGAESGANALAIVRRAETLAGGRSDSLQVNLLEARVLLRTGKFAAVSRLADRLLTNVSARDAADARRLLPLAMLVGRADAAQQLLTLSTTVSAQQPDGLPRNVASTVAAYVVSTGLGACSEHEMRRTNAVTALRTAVAAAEFERMADRFLAQAEWMELTCPGAPLPRGAMATDPLIRAFEALRTGRTRDVQTILRQTAATRSGASASSIAWDTRFSESWLLVQSGDTAGARALFRAAITDLPATMDYVLSEPAQGASLRRSLALCAAIVPATDSVAGSACRAGSAALSKEGRTGG